MQTQQKQDKCPNVVRQYLDTSRKSLLLLGPIYMMHCIYVRPKADKASLICRTVEAVGSKLDVVVLHLNAMYSVEC